MGEIREHEDPEQKSVLNDSIAKKSGELIEQLAEKNTGDFRIYTSSERREYFREDAEAMCRHALAIKADVMLFFDKSARGYGLLSKRILPIIQLEYAHTTNTPLSEIKNPEIKFFDPEMEFGTTLNRSQFVYGATDEKFGAPVDQLANQEEAKELDVYLEKLRSIFGKQFEGKTILLCDESSGKGGGLGLPSAKSYPTEQYNHYKSKEFKDNFNRTYNAMSNTSTATAWKAKMQKIFPGASFDTHVGSSDTQGGDDQIIDIRDEGGTTLREIIWGIESVEPEDVIVGERPGKYGGTMKFNIRKGLSPIVRRKKPSAEDTKKIKAHGFKDIRDAQKQLRIELDKIAAESAKNLLKK